MAKKYRILVVCGTGIATSTAAENKLQQWFDKKGYTVATSQCIAADRKFLISHHRIG
jgi:galactitol-specific phosphotransferase system IIB component